MYPNCTTTRQAGWRTKIKIREGVPPFVEQSLLSQRRAGGGIVYKQRSELSRTGWVILPTIARRWGQIFDRLMLEGVVSVQLDPDGAVIKFATAADRETYADHFAQIINEIIETRVRMEIPAVSAGTSTGIRALAARPHTSTRGSA